MDIEALRAQIKEECSPQLAAAIDEALEQKWLEGIDYAVDAAEPFLTI